MDKWKICPECKGTGELICANCGGIGCPACEGTGRVRCDRCGGYFEIRIEEDYSLKGIMRSIDKRLHGLLHTKKTD